MEIIGAILAFFGIQALGNSIARRHEKASIKWEMENNPPTKVYPNGDRLYVESGSCSAFVGAYAERIDQDGNLVQAGYVPIDDVPYEQTSGF